MEPRVADFSCIIKNLPSEKNLNELEIEIIQYFKNLNLKDNLNYKI